MINKSFIVLFVPLAVAISTRTLLGFETDTHTILSERATNASQLSNFLTTTLRFEFPDGVLQEVGQGNFRTVRQLIANVGAVNEDSPEFRSRTHFHDPTKVWAEAGLTSPFTPTFQSSILWSQNPNQDLGGKHSWQDARTSYFNALTATDKADRKKYYAETFESLGHLIHLVQDAATPAHTRNDWHVGLTTGSTAFPFLNVDRFHQWARKEIGETAINAAGSQPFDSSILNQTYNGLVPIAGIIDTTTTAGPATPSEATNIGIAEYSNANFFSDDTIFSYAYPNITQMELSQEAGPDGPEERSYLRKSFAPGPTGYRAAVSTSLIYKLPANFPILQLELDDNVMADYGALLFPRAIGYSAGMIDYFFRGKIDSTAWWSPGYIWVSWSERPTSIRVENVAVKVDETNEQGGQGTMQLVLVYSYKWNETPQDGPEVVVSHPVSVSSSSSAQTLVFQFDSLPFPSTYPTGNLGASDYYGYAGILVYKGALGQESEAVVAAGYCMDPTTGSKYPRFYQFEHSGSFNGQLIDGHPIESAYIDYGC